MKKVLLSGDICIMYSINTTSTDPILIVMPGLKEWRIAPMDQVSGAFVTLKDVPGEVNFISTFSTNFDSANCKSVSNKSL